MRKGLRLQEKLIIISVGTILLAIGTTLSINLHDFTRAYKESIFERVFAHAERLNDIVSEVTDLGLGLGELVGLNSECQRLVSIVPFARDCLIMDNDGVVHYHNDPSQVGKIYKDPVTQKALQAGGRLVQLARRPTGEPVYAFTLPVKNLQDEQLGLIRIDVLTDIVTSKIRVMQNRALVIGFISVIGAIIVLSLIFRVSIVRSIHELMRGITSFAAGEWDNKIAIPRSDEIGDLAKAFNAMADTLKETTVSVHAIEEEKKRFQDVASSSEDWIWEIDHKIHYTFSSPIVEKLLGYTPEEVVGKRPDDFIHPDDRELFKQKLADVIMKKEPFRNMVSRSIRKDDMIVILETSGVPILDEAGKFFGIRGVHRDITERVQAEEAIKSYSQELQELATQYAEANVRLEFAKNEADEANKAKGRFLANISHEIRTPLNCIIGFAETMVRNESVPELHRQAGTILREAETLLMLINEVLDHAKIEAGKLTIESYPFDLYELLDHIERIFSSQAQAKGLVVRSVREDGVPQFVEGDALRVRQIVVNLVGNALKFTHEGSVTIAVRPVSTEGETVRVRFEVIDTGIGISKERQQNIFQSFTQADSSTTRKYGGTGLGTTIAKQLVEMMGGVMGLASEEGKGSTFWFELPFAVSSADKVRELSGYAAEQPDTGAVQPSGKILLAEDYAPNQEIVRAHLSSVGYVLTIVETGTMALELLGKEHFDLILMDVQMPEMDGYEATRRIRADYPDYRKTPIIGMTAHAHKEAHDACRDAGMDDVITKPIRRASFLAAINTWMAKVNS